MALRTGPAPAIHTTTGGMEYAIVAAPKRVTDQLTAIFGAAIGAAADMVVVPTCQRAECDLVNTGDKVDEEKDRLLENFVAWAVAVCGRLSSAGYWCDYIDPCSGLPMMHKTTQTPYSEVEGLSLLLGYRTANAGCCKVVLHPKWGTSSYPATLFARAPAEAIKAAIRGAEEQIAAAKA
ncbi:methylmalonic aciduria and homocystinuria type D mitochondrial [Raphidocelis subcapitata]|uniref:Methylmalonic aciduria and homocystinuria type D mitochondrial n=1 Tax=Raphidocelis subcapitata TaxID=307507 RepID=A0A2V0PGB4_9CHLO|nr:methylmalonic aciduria and homocystinuria type D mitochondrial [Raphidocelis subcapitata]|eukprot:GBF98898.1 methylmalonic aciduria and homocystinuria type D mitochondrial [Raphidocelis subcapitata]